MDKTKQRVAREREKGGNPARYYRKQYIKFTGILILSQNFDIHHLDHNWKNNKPANLVAIPKPLHERWHRYEKRRLVAYSNGKIFMDAKLVQDTNSRLHSAVVGCIGDLMCWIDYRDYLLGNIGLNLHNLSYE